MPVAALFMSVISIIKTFHSLNKTKIWQKKLSYPDLLPDFELRYLKRPLWNIFEIRYNRVLYFNRKKFAESIKWEHKTTLRDIFQRLKRNIDALIPQTGFQTDTLKSLYDWLTLSDSIFEWLRVHLASISLKIVPSIYQINLKSISVLKVYQLKAYLSKGLWNSVLQDCLYSSSNRHCSSRYYSSRSFYLCTAIINALWIIL